MLVVLTIKPIFIFYVLRKGYKLGTLESDDFKKRFGTLTKEMRDLEWKTLSLPLIVWLRSLSLVLLLLSDNTSVQLLVYRLTLLLFLIYLFHQLPYSAREKHLDETVNNLFLLCNCFLMPLFTEYVADPEMRYSLGWLQVALFSAQMCYIFGKVIKSLCLTFYSRIRKLYVRYVKKRQTDELKEK